MIVIVTPPATEPLTVSDVIAHLRLDASNQESPPSVVTAALASPAAPGNVTVGAHRYLATFVTADGETQAGTASAVVTVADGAVNGQVSLTAIPVGGSLVTSRKLYRTLASGAAYHLLATIPNNTVTTYTDNVADASLGVEVPSVNTTLDPLLSRFIITARQGAEQQLKHSLITQTLDLYLHEFPHKHDMRIFLPPIQSVVSITYTDIDGVAQTLATDQYLVDDVSRPARIEPAYGLAWPSCREQMNAVKVRFVAGYGTAAQVPSCVKDWMLFQINTMWNTRQQFTISTGSAALTQIPNQYIDSLLDPERVTGRV